MVGLPTLYKKNKNGSYQQWTVSTVGAEIISEYGQVDGALQRTSKEAKPKNIGKSNEVTAEAQAVKQAESMWKKKLDKGYAETKEGADNTPPLPMLAQSFEEHKDKIKWLGKCHYVQPKLDGVRCTTRWVNGELKLFSRKNKEWVNLGHIVDSLVKILPKDMVFDGEIYVHGLTFQEVTKLVKKNQSLDTALGEKTTTDLEFHVYDGYKNPKEPYSRRRWSIWNNIPRDKALRPNIVPVKTYKVYSSEEVMKAHDAFVRDGYEGAIFRHRDGEYTVGHRSRDLLKVKAFSDAEYRIVDFYEGEGRYKGAVTWVCDVGDGRTFHCVPKGTMVQKREWYEEGDKYVGQWLKVKFFEFTDDGIPRFPVGIGIRLPEDMS